MLQPQQHIGKRIFDLMFSLVLLPIVLPLLLIIWLLACFSTRNNGWFVQTRIGLEGKPFKLFKIRTLKGQNHQDVLEMKAMETDFGRWLRKTKLDELPQVFNVLKGDMSWVGPRPDIPGYADLL
ncbi:MAG TPA: sugar transferase, partial [Flavobacteriaceae bacterium]|nr:sugar transferase [Flavobacteriaceae bacterium]